MFMLPNSDKLIVEFLHIKPGSLQVLKKYGIRTIGSLLKNWRELGPELNRSHREHILDLLDTFVASSKGVSKEYLERGITEFSLDEEGTSTDWSSFYTSVLPDVYYLAFKCQEFEILEDAKINFGLSKDRFGVGARCLYDWFQISDFSALKQLLEKAKPLPPNMGNKKLLAIFDGLLELTSLVRGSGITENSQYLGSENFRKKLEQRLTKKNFLTCAAEEEEIPVPILELQLKSIHIGSKLPKFEHVGIHTISDFLAFQNKKGHSALSGVGAATFDQINCHVNSLVDQVTVSENMNLEQYFAGRGIEFIDHHGPSGTYPTNPKALIEPIRRAMQAFYPEHAHLCSRRLLAPPRKQMSLEDCGTKYSPALTREAVRQKEKAILETLGDALIDQRYEKANFHFCTEISNAWAALYDTLLGRKLTHSVVQRALVDNFGFTSLEAFEVLNITIGILSGSLPIKRKNFLTIAEDTSAILESEAKARYKMSALYIDNKNRPTLNNIGVLFISDFLSYINMENNDKNLLPRDIASLQETCEHINILQRTSRNRGTFNRDAYARELGLKFFPVHSKGSVDQFFQSLNTTFSAILRYSNIKGMDALLERRILVSLDKRETFNVIAAETECHFQTLLRNQKKLLSILREYFIEQKINNNEIHIRQWFWDFFLVCFDKFQEGDGKFETFSEALTKKFEIPLDQYLDQIWGLWTIFTQKVYANNSKGIQKVRRFAIPSDRYDSGSQVVVLRGFDRLH